MINKLVSTIIVKPGRRVGRGIASKKGGHTSGRGTKGARSRSGYALARPGFEGGQLPLSRRIPKLRGFRRAFFKDKYPTFTVPLMELESRVNRINEDLMTLEPKKILDLLGLTSSHQYAKIKIVNNKTAANKKTKKITDLLEKLSEAGVMVSKSVQQL